MALAMDPNFIQSMDQNAVSYLLFPLHLVLLIIDINSFNLFKLIYLSFFYEKNDNDGPIFIIKLLAFFKRKSMAALPDNEFYKINTPIGLVLKMSSSELIPYGFRKMKLNEGK